MASSTDEVGARVALDLIRVPKNVRALDEQHVKALAGSLELQGVLVPVVVRPMTRRTSSSPAFTVSRPLALGLTDVAVVVPDAESEEADRATRTSPHAGVGMR